MNQTWMRHPDAAIQTLDFGKIVTPGNTHPSDMDCWFEGRRFAPSFGYVFCESKSERGHFSKGQKDAFEQLIKDLGKANVTAIALNCVHTVFDTSKSIPLDQSRVIEVFANFPIWFGAKICVWINVEHTGITVNDVFKWMYR